MAVGAVELVVLAGERVIDQRHLTVAALETALVPVTLLVRQVLHDSHAPHAPDNPYINDHTDEQTVRARLTVDQLINLYFPPMVFTVRCTIVQSVFLRSHVVCPSVHLSVTLVDRDHIGLKPWKLIA